MTSGLPLWKKLVLATYCLATSPQRYRARRRFARSGHAPIMVLFYHRIASEVANEWTISLDEFCRQIDWLQRRFELVTLAEAQRRIRAGVNHRPAVSLTFDDGYAVNCERALPLLLERAIPCTYFVCSDNVLHGRPFPHDVERGAPLQPNSVGQLRELVSAGVEIGCHTRTHADLSRVDSPAQLAEEIQGARSELQQALRTPVRFFAFPYGLPQHLPPDAVALARAAGYQAVCSAFGGYNFPGEEGFHLRRIHADGDFLRFKNWLTLDPRKVATAGRIEPAPSDHGECKEHKPPITSGTS